MNDLPEVPRLPGYTTYLKQWALLHLRKAFIWSTAAHLVLFGALGIWWRISGGPHLDRRLVLREWQTTPQLFLRNVPIILQEGGGGGPGSMESPPGPGKGSTPVKTPPLAVPVPVPDDEVSNPEASIATQEEAKVASLVVDEKADTSAGGGGGGGGGTGGGYGGGTGSGVGEGEGFGNAAFQTPPIPVKLVMPSIPRSMGKKVSGVKVMVLVDETGNVVEDQVFESSGFAALDSLAADAARQTRFIPAKQKGKVIKAWTVLGITFTR